MNDTIFYGFTESDSGNVLLGACRKTSTCYLRGLVFFFTP
jgi:hypothetical protein